MAAVRMSIPLGAASSQIYSIKMLTVWKPWFPRGGPRIQKLSQDTDAIIVYSDGGAGHLSIPHLEQISELANQGMGIAMLHYAVEVPER